MAILVGDLWLVCEREGEFSLKALWLVKTPPALLLFRPGVEEAASMPIPRKKDEFNEDALVDSLKGHLK